jgi:DNA-binding transcriptional ArsR family regulator
MPSDATFESPISQALGYPARVAILGVLVESREETLGATSIATQAGIDPSTFHDHREALLNLGFMRKHEQTGYPTYSLANTERAKLLVELNDSLVRASEDSAAYQESVEEFLE